MSNIYIESHISTNQPQITTHREAQTLLSPQEKNVKFCTTKISRHYLRKRSSPGSISPVEAQVPLPHQVRGVASLAEPLGQGVHV